MEKKTVFVPINPKDELPPKNTDVFTLFRQLLQGGLQPDLLLTYKKEKWFDDEGEQQPAPAAWLKEQELYVFQPAELFEFAKEILRKGVNIGIENMQFKDMTLGMIIPDFQTDDAVKSCKEFIESLGIK